MFGATKPSPRLFDAALLELGLPAKEVLFVDDGPEIVRGALAYGLDAWLLKRDGDPEPAPPGLPLIRRLQEVLDHFMSSGVG